MDFTRIALYESQLKIILISLSLRAVYPLSETVLAPPLLRQHPSDWLPYINRRFEQQVASVLTATAV